MAIAWTLPDIGESQPLPSAGGFEAGETVRLDGELTVGRSTVSWTVAIPENRIYDGVAILAPGFSGIKDSSVAPGLAHAHAGVMTAWYEPARKSGHSFGYDIGHAQELHAATLKGVFKDIKERRLEIATSAPNGRTIDFDRHLLLAHSMGGLSATKYAAQESGSTEAILHKASCGFGGPDPRALAIDVPLGSLAGLQHEIIPSFRRGEIEHSWRSARKFIDYWRHLQVIAEMVSCLTEDVRETTAELIDQGITVDYEAYAHDVLIRPSQETANFVSSHRISPNAGHMAPIRRAAEVAKGSAATISQL